MASRRKPSKVTRFWNRSFFPPVLILCVVLAVASPFLLTGWHTDAVPYDWGLLYTGAELARRAWINWAPYFSWVPWVCGGVPSANENTMKLFDPPSILAIFIGVLPAEKWVYVLWQALGAWGTARVIKRLIPAAGLEVTATAGLVFGLQGFFLYHLRPGHFGFAPFAAFPWLFEGFLLGDALLVSSILGFMLLTLGSEEAAHFALFSVYM